MGDTDRTTCRSCNAVILPATAANFDGYCAPCFKSINAIPPRVQNPMPPPSLLSKIFGWLIPIGGIALFVIGIPLGYKLILGGSRSTVTSGTIHALHLTHPIADRKLEGRKARIIADYLVIEMDGGRKLWVSEENIVGVEFEPED